MTELFEIHTGKISTAELIPRVTKAIGGSLKGKFLIGLFYERNDYLYCYSVPGNENERNWNNTPTEATGKWEASNPNDSRVIINPFLV